MSSRYTPETCEPSCEEKQVSRTCVPPLTLKVCVMVWYAVYGFRHSHLGRHEHVGLIHD